jgi:hypothetical protein
MYNESVVERETAKLEQRLGIRLIRYDRDYSLDVEEHLINKCARMKQQNPNITPEQAIQQCTAEERAFIRNERLLCSLDFRYWTRYAQLLPDAAVSDGSLMRFEPWESQAIILDEMARIEGIQYDRAMRGEPQDGVLIAVPKARQEGISLLAAMVDMHRVSTNPFTFAIRGTENEEKRLNLYERDIRIHSNLPFYLQPERTSPDIQGERLSFGAMDCKMVYQDYMQEGSLAAGEQYPVGHMSELAQGNQAYVEKLCTLDYFPAIPRSWRSCHLLESTPAGMGGFWHPFIMDEYRGAGRWRVKFIPWYTLEFKYSAFAPADWMPSQTALDHAEKVAATSHEYLGRQVTLTRNQLYWWETERESARRKGKLVYFLTNYPATLEESFQTLNTSIFDPETIDFYNMMIRDPGGCYEIRNVQ